MSKLASSNPSVPSTPLARQINALKHRYLQPNSSSLFYLSALVVNVGNYGFNLLLGRWLGPAAFSDLSLIITLFLGLTFVTTGLQQTAAKFAASYAGQNNTQGISNVRTWLMRRAWLVGGVSLLALTLGAPAWQAFFNTQSPALFVCLGLAIPFYFAQGIDRGILQGQTRFDRLSVSYQAEMWSRLAVAFVLVTLGWGALGGGIGLALSILATWWVARAAGQHLPASAAPSADELHQYKRIIIAIAWAEIGLILINNSDVLLVKRFFEAEQAGHYAALSLIGRVVFFATSAASVTLFAQAAQRQARGEAHRPLLWRTLGVVSVISLVIVLACIIMPNLIVQILFGDAYMAIAGLLWQYALATALFAASNVVINYQLALGHQRSAVLSLIAGVLQVILISLFHTSLAQVVLVQICLMSVLLIAVLGLESKSVAR